MGLLGGLWCSFKNCEYRLHLCVTFYIKLKRGSVKLRKVGEKDNEQEQ